MLSALNSSSKMVRPMNTIADYSILAIRCSLKSVLGYRFMSERPSISIFFKLNKNTEALTDVKVLSKNTSKADFYSAVIAFICQIMEQDLGITSKEEALEFCKTFIVQEFD